MEKKELTKAFIIKIFKEKLWDTMLSHGFIYTKGLEYAPYPHFIKQTDFGSISIHLQVTSDCSSTFIAPYLGFDEIENFIFNEDLKLLNLTQLSKSDRTFYLYSWETEAGKQWKLRDESAVYDYINIIINYMNTIGFDFINEYSTLENIFEILSENPYKVKNYLWGGIVDGGIDRYYRVLILSKLCNDLKFEEKVNLINKEIKQGIAGENSRIWLAIQGLFEQSLPIIKTIQPKYNL
jgi:hypothetical protein